MSQPTVHSSQLKLDLGSGSRPREGFVGVDIAALENVVAFDLTSGDKWPWKDGEVEELTSSHFIEHIQADYVEVMRSSWPLALGQQPYRSVDEMLEPKAKSQKLVSRVSQDRLLFFFDEAYRVIRADGLFHLEWPALKSTDAFRDPTHRRFLPLEFTLYLSQVSREMMGLQHYEARCNWETVEGSARMILNPERRSVPGSSDREASDELWDRQRAFQVTLRAVK